MFLIQEKNFSSKIYQDNVKNRQAIKIILLCLITIISITTSFAQSSEIKLEESNKSNDSTYHAMLFFDTPIILGDINADGIDDAILQFYNIGSCNNIERMSYSELQISKDSKLKLTDLSPHIDKWINLNNYAISCDGGFMETWYPSAMMVPGYVLFISNSNTYTTSEIDILNTFSQCLFRYADISAIENGEILVNLNNVGRAGKLFIHENYTIDIESYYKYNSGELKSTDFLKCSVCQKKYTLKESKVKFAFKKKGNFDEEECNFEFKYRCCSDSCLEKDHLYEHVRLQLKEKK